MKYFPCTPRRTPWLSRLSCLSLLACLASVAALDDWIWAKAIPRTGWKVRVDNFHPGQEAEKAIDGDPATFWHSMYQPDAPLPHYIQVDMGKVYIVNGIDYLPRQDGLNGIIGQHTVTVSVDGKTWTAPVAFGNWPNGRAAKQSFFTTVPARFVRLTAQSEAEGLAGGFTSAAEFNVYSPDPNRDASSFRTPPPKTQGAWDVTIDFPLSPAAGVVSHKDMIVVWSAVRMDQFTPQGQGTTETATWNPANMAVSHRTVAETKHDMFCPGLSTDTEGDVMVTGGNNAEKTSIYIPDSDSWTAAADMHILRGYQSSTTLADGRTFVLGGSWAGDRAVAKNGEVFSPKTKAWQNLPGAAVEPIRTKDQAGLYRSDNHAWLFSWTNNSIVQLGPSSAMHWYHVSGQGSWKEAGTRGDDGDSMCGVAVMYDAGAGLVLTAGGAPSYEHSDAKSSAHIIKIDAVDGKPTVTKINDMAHRRGFVNGVLLPDGKVVIIGGQSYVVTWTDTNATLPAELFDPATNKFTEVAPIIVPRNYHSFALLLPDGRVLSAGGGLCGTGCKANHYDGQVWSPPYLFNVDGSRADRPVIKSAAPLALKPGATLTVTTDVPATFSLVRYGSSTHTVNTDQRRFVLDSTAQDLAYTLRMPSDPGRLIAGYWMLFAMNKQGVPSVSTKVKVLMQ